MKKMMMVMIMMMMRRTRRRRKKMQMRMIIIIVMMRTMVMTMMMLTRKKIMTIRMMGLKRSVMIFKSKSSIYSKTHPLVIMWLCDIKGFLVINWSV